MVSPMMMGIQKTRRSVWAGVDVELLTTTEIHRYSMSEFSGSILQVGIAKICSRLGFDFAEKHALDMLVDVVGKYIETIGLLAKTLAEHDGRTKCNLLDLLQAFEALEPVRLDWKDLVKMTQDKMWDVEFASGIPDYPVPAPKRQKTLQYGDNTVQELPSYIPSFFPEFPPSHTYRSTPIDATKPLVDPREIVQSSLEEKRLVQKALARIQRDETKQRPDRFGSENERKDQSDEVETQHIDQSDKPSLPSAFLGP